MHTQSIGSVEPVPLGIGRPLLVHHVARRLGISCRTVRHLAKTGKLPGFRAGKKIWLFLPADVETLRVWREERYV
jgi:excisionase family DNA binding protein